jgi:hypothetical protein
MLNNYMEMMTIFMYLMYYNLLVLTLLMVHGFIMFDVLIIYQLMV